MTTKQRRERERELLRQSILDAAREIALQEGWQSVTIRKVAERIEYSPPTIYEYFDSKEAILFDLMRLGFRLLNDDLKAARLQAPHARAGVLHMAFAYWDFAWKYPELYQVMNGLGGVPFCPDMLPLESDDVFLTAVEGVQAVVGVGVDTKRVEENVKLIWATLHGLICLSMARVPEVSDGRSLVERAVENMLAVMIRA